MSKPVSIGAAIKDMADPLNESPLEIRLRRAFVELGVKFQQQVKVGKRRLDFLVEDLNVEVDGKEFHTFAEDLARDRYVFHHGLAIVRVPGTTVYHCPLAAAAYITMYFTKQGTVAMDKHLPLEGDCYHPLRFFVPPNIYSSVAIQRIADQSNRILAREMRRRFS